MHFQPAGMMDQGKQRSPVMCLDPGLKKYYAMAIVAIPDPTFIRND